MRIAVRWLFADREVMVEAFPSDTLEILKARVMKELSLPNYTGGFLILEGHPLHPKITLHMAGVNPTDRLELNGF